MRKAVHIQLDEETCRLLERLRGLTGQDESALVRRGLHALADVMLLPRGRMPIGVGRFESGVPDRASHKEHLRGFGA